MEHTGASVREDAVGTGDGDDEGSGEHKHRAHAMPTRRVTQGR